MWTLVNQIQVQTRAQITVVDVWVRHLNLVQIVGCKTKILSHLCNKWDLQFLTWIKTLKQLQIWLILLIWTLNHLLCKMQQQVVSSRCSTTSSNSLLLLLPNNNSWLKHRLLARTTLNYLSIGQEVPSMRAQNLCLNNLFCNKVWVKTAPWQQLLICYLLLSSNIREWCSRFLWQRHHIKEQIYKICPITCQIRLSLEDFSSSRIQLLIRILHLQFTCHNHSTQLIKVLQISNSFSSIHPLHISKTLWCNLSFSMLLCNSSNNSSSCNSINNNNKTSLNQIAQINIKVSSNSTWIRCEYIISNEYQKCIEYEFTHPHTQKGLELYTYI